MTTDPAVGMGVLWLLVGLLMSGIAWFKDEPPSAHLTKDAFFAVVSIVLGLGILIGAGWRPDH